MLHIVCFWILRCNCCHIIESLKKLKTNYIANESKIIPLEKKLDEIVDNKLRNQLEATSNFEILQNEKITPFFLNLAKGSKAEASLSDQVGRCYEGIHTEFLPKNI